MREILFKAKRIDNGDWVEGNYITDEQDKEKAYIGYIFGIEDFDIVEVNPETLCQYTELKDKNGNRIWENDIVRIENSMDEGIGNVELYGGMW